MSQSFYTYRHRQQRSPVQNAFYSNNFAGGPRFINLASAGFRRDKITSRMSWLVCSAKFTPPLTAPCPMDRSPAERSRMAARSWSEVSCCCSDGSKRSSGWCLPKIAENVTPCTPCVIPLAAPPHDFFRGSFRVPKAPMNTQFCSPTSAGHPLADQGPPHRSEANLCVRVQAEHHRGVPVQRCVDVVQDLLRNSGRARTRRGWRSAPGRPNTIEAGVCGGKTFLPPATSSQWLDQQLTGRVR